MEQVSRARTKADLDVRVSIDAVKLSASAFVKDRFQENPAYQLRYDYRVDGTSKEKLYNRARGYLNTVTGSKIGIAYNPVESFMPPCIVTVSPNDKTGLKRPELQALVDLLPDYRFLKIELAHDFCAGSVVDESFTREHLLVGKSQRREDPEHPDTIYFGARLSPVFTRCYWKKAIDSYRIEIEFHREWLKKHRIETPADFAKLPELTARRYIAFFRIDSLKLSAALMRLGVPVASSMRKIIARQDDLYQALRFLRSQLGVTNSRRVLTPLVTNVRVERALQEWAEEWKKTGTQFGRGGVKKDELAGLLEVKEQA